MLITFAVSISFAYEVALKQAIPANNTIIVLNTLFFLLFPKVKMLSITISTATTIAINIFVSPV